MSQHDTLTQALQDAASSLETISRLAGKAAHPNGDETCMGTFPEVRGYATSRAAVARAALSATQPAQGETALQKFTRFKVAETKGSPVEQLHVFCSFAMNGQDWFDVEPFFDRIREAQAVQSEPVTPLFAAKIAARKWAELQEQGARMQSIAFDGGKGGAGTIDPWGVVRWDQAAQGAGEVVAWAILVDDKAVTLLKSNGVAEIASKAGEVVRPLAYADTQPAAGADVLDAGRWRYAMDWDTKDFAVCRRVGTTGTCWEPIKTDGPIDAAIAASGRQE